jgi:ketosteroid isomerase-like protein
MAIVLVTGAVAFAQGTVDKAVMDLERQWVKAALASDGAAIAPLLAASFVSIQSDGTLQTKAEYVATTTKNKWQMADVSDMKVQVHGDAAVVTGVWAAKGTVNIGTAKPFDGKERFADTWVKMPDGKWQCVASASAPMK